MRKSSLSFLPVTSKIWLVCIVAAALMANGAVSASSADWRKTSATQTNNLTRAVKQSGTLALKANGLTLVDNGKLVYDANQRVFWLADADLAADATIRAQMGVAGINPDSTMTFPTALLWVKTLNHGNHGSGYLGHTNWQLPVTPPLDSTCSVLHGNDGNSFAADCTGSAWGNLFYDGLALTFPGSVVPGFTDTVAPFQNLQPSLYWTSQANSSGQKTFSFLTGLTGANTTKYNFFYVLPLIASKIGMTGPGTGFVPYVGGLAAGKAVYDSVTKVTWVLDAHLAHSDNFGITGTKTITTSSGSLLTVPLIDTSGAMLFAIAGSTNANSWLKAMNDSSYAGVSSWTLPAPADLQTLFNHLKLNPGDSRLTAVGNVGPFQNLQPYFFWACERDQIGSSQSPCNGSSPAPNFAWSFLLDTGFQATDLTTKEFYVEVYIPAFRVMLPIVDSPN